MTEDDGVQGVQALSCKTTLRDIMKKKRSESVLLSSLPSVFYKVLKPSGSQLIPADKTHLYYENKATISPV